MTYVTTFDYKNMLRENTFNTLSYYTQLHCNHLQASLLHCTHFTLSALSSSLLHYTPLCCAKLHYSAGQNTVLKNCTAEHCSIFKQNSYCHPSINLEANAG